jgi:hypothetical protein
MKINNSPTIALCSQEVEEAMQRIGADLHLLKHRQELTQELAAAWFLENFDIDINARRLFNRSAEAFGWEAQIDCRHLKGKSYADTIEDKLFPSKEEAMNAGFLKASTLIP